MTDSRQDVTIANFGVYSDKVIHATLSMRDYVRYFPTMAQWVGFQSTAVEVEHARRSLGTSSYSLQKLLNLGIDNMIVFSDKPLRLAVKAGMSVCVLTIVVASVYLYSYLSGGIIVSGYASLILSIWFLGGIIIFLVGVVGVYLGKTFDQTKRRPTHIVQEVTDNIKSRMKIVGDHYE